MPAAQIDDRYLARGRGREHEADAQAFGTDLSLVKQSRGFYTKGQRIDKPVSTAEMMTMCGLDYTVIQEPVHDPRGKVIPGVVRNTRADNTDITFGVVTPRYKVIQPQDGFAAAESFVQNGYGWEAGGITKHGGFAWGILAYQDTWTVAGEPMDKKVLWILSHKGDMSNTMAITPLRPWCTNALNLTNGFGKSRHRVPHTGDIESKMLEGLVLMGAAGDYFDGFARVADRLATEWVTERRVKNWLDKLYPSGTGDSAKPANDKTKQQIMDLLASAENLANHRNGNRYSGWAFVNAVGEHADWGSNRKREPMARLCGGMDEGTKNNALVLAMDQLGIASNN